MTERIKNSREGQNETVFDRQWQEAEQNYINAHTVEVNSRYAYAGDISQLKDFLSEHAADNWLKVTPQMMRDFFTDQQRRFSPATLYRRLTVINGLLTYIQKRTDFPINKDVFQTIRSFRKENSNLPRRNFDYESMSREDVTKLLQVTTHVRDKALIYLLLKGISAQSLENLEMQNVKASANVQYPTMQISVPDKKTGKIKTVNLDAAAGQALNEYLLDYRGRDLKTPDSPVFINSHSFSKTGEVAALTRQGIGIIINKCAKIAQIETTPHRLNKSAKILHESTI